MAISATVSGRVAEVFYSIQGEGATARLPAVFARLQGRFRVHTPLITLTKAQIVLRAWELGVDLSLTWSCYARAPAPLLAS